MLFDLPAELYASRSDKAVLAALHKKQLTLDDKPRRPVKLSQGDTSSSRKRAMSQDGMALPQWLDAPKYSVRIVDVET
jgi:hypothetical protein